MTAKNLYEILVREHGLNKKLSKREIYDKVLENLGINAKQLGGYVSVLSRKHALTATKTTIELHETVWE